MKPMVKVAIVAGGYLVAFLMASAAVALHSALSGESGAQASGGMSAFGDLILFVAVFGAVAVVPTGAAFIFLMSRKRTLHEPPDPAHSAGTPPAGHEPRHQ
jgi:hypothetical protein